MGDEPEDVDDDRGAHGAPDAIGAADRDRARAVMQEMTGPDGYLPALVLLFFTAVFAPLLGDSALGAILTLTTAALAVLATLGRTIRQLQRRRRMLIAAAVVWVCGVLSVLIGDNAEGPTNIAGIVLLVVYIVLLAVSFPALLVRALQHRRVSLNTLCATMSAYFVIGLVFAACYRLIQQIAPPMFVQTAAPTPGQATYFSFITLATVGYGDLTPASDPARSIVMVEAIIGQVFLVTIVARVVSLLGDERSGRSSDDA